ncbi:MAG: CRISPR-associated protein Cas4 [Saprospiraceae bacterium]|jgi:CRISPR-associated exonuclease Cas4|nr:CRISPR-associated protein Cas4 [Saprospiraceae bacterium]
MSFSITPSHIIEYLFCPRFTYFEYVLRIPQYEDKFFKVNRGREVHEQKARQNIEYMRRRLGVREKYLNQYLTNDLLRGEVDEVLVLNNGTMAPLDYKFAKFEGKVYETYKTQLYCYAWLILDNFGAEVRSGYLIYTRSKNKLVEVEITEQSLKKAKMIAVDIQRIMSENRYPKATKYKKRCLSCTYRNICTK